MFFFVLWISEKMHFDLANFKNKKKKSKWRIINQTSIMFFHMFSCFPCFLYLSFHSFSFSISKFQNGMYRIFFSVFALHNSSSLCCCSKSSSSMYSMILQVLPGNTHGGGGILMIWYIQQNPWMNKKKLPASISING